MPISVRDEVSFELSPGGGPRWVPNPDRKNEFIDAGYTGEYGAGSVQRIYEHDGIKMMTVIFNSTHDNIAGINLPINLYNQNKHFSGFYNVRCAKPDCECGAGDGGAHWLFCPAWER